MDSFWKGAFTPIVKHISNVQYLRFEDMTKDLWDVFDYPRLAPVPKRRLQSHIMNCTLQGFYIVDVDQHLGKVHGGKPRYIWPTADGEGREFNEEKAIAEFGNFDGYDEEVDTIATFEREFRTVARRSSSRIFALIAGLIYKAYVAQQPPPPAQSQEETEEEAEQVDEDEIKAYLEDRFRDWPRWAATLMYLRYEKCGVPDEILADIT